MRVLSERDVRELLDMESCVEIAPIPCVEDAYAVRDSKNPEAGTLRFTGAELRAAGLTTI